MSDKTEEATPKRLRRAQEEGDSGTSAFAAQSIAFVASLVVVPFAATALFTRASDDLKSVLAQANAGTTRDSALALAFDPSSLAAEILTLTLPLLAVAAIAGAVAHLVQTGGMMATKRLTPKLDKLNVFEGMKNLFSSARLFTVARSLFGAAAVAWLAVRALEAHTADLARLGGRLAPIGVAVREIAGGLARRTAALGLGLAVIDIVATRRAWMMRLRMSKEEVKREYKESEGDPQMKAARERAHKEVIASATIANVKTASIVIVNPTHIACALRYDEKDGDEAPVVVASGEGDLAARIRRAAEDYGVPVVRDVPLAHALAELEIGDAIPEALYEAVAEILRDAWEQESGEHVSLDPKS